MNRPHLVLRYSYPALWAGALLLGFIGVTSLIAPIQFLLFPPPAVPGKPVNTTLIAIVAAVFGGVFTLLGLLLARMASRMSERFEIGRDGITWFKNRKPQAVMRWTQIERIQLEFNSTDLLIEGPPDIPSLQISNAYKGFDEFLQILQQNVDWETLVQAPSRATSHASNQPGPDSTNAASITAATDSDFSPPNTKRILARNEQPSLPLVYNRRGGFIICLVGMIVLYAATVGVWCYPAQANVAQQLDAAKLRTQKRDAAAFQFIKYFILPLLCVVGTPALFRIRIEFRADENGIEQRYFLRQRRFEWKELQSVTVGLTTVVINGVKHYHHSLMISPREGKPITVALGNDSFLWRDTIQAAARSGGMPLRDDKASEV